jgi:hypothetical protein
VDVSFVVFALTIAGALVGTLATRGAPRTTAWTLACVALVAVSPIAMELAWRAAQPVGPQESTSVEPLEPPPPTREIVRTPNFGLTLVAVGPGGDVYFDDAGGSLRVRTHDGRVSVVFSTDEKVHFGPGAIAADATIYTPTTGRLHAFDAEGKPRWTYSVPQRIRPRVLAVGEDGTVYVAIGTGTDSPPSLRAVTKDGREKWAIDIPVTGASAGSDGAVFVTSDRGVSAYGADGTLLWHVDGRFDAQPAIGADGMVYVAAPRTFTAISPAGTRKWSADITPMRSHHAHTPCVSPDGTLYVLNSTLWAVDSAGVVKWRWTPAGAPPTRGLVQAQDGTIIVGAVTGEVYGLTTDGKLRWIHDGPPLQAMRLDGETLYLGLEQQIVALDLRR